MIIWAFVELPLSKVLEFFIAFSLPITEAIVKGPNWFTIFAPKSPLLPPETDANVPAANERLILPIDSSCTISFS